MARSISQIHKLQNLNHKTCSQHRYQLILGHSVCATSQAWGRCLACFMLLFPLSRLLSLQTSKEMLMLAQLFQICPLFKTSA